jgi:fructose 1,6-bisphosphatase
VFFGDLRYRRFDGPGRVVASTKSEVKNDGEFFGTMDNQDDENSTVLFLGTFEELSDAHG